MDWIGLGGILRDVLWIGLGHVVVIVIALSDCQCVQIFRLSFDVNCCITNWLLLVLL